MARDLTRESLVSALAHCSLRDLPSVDNGEDVWISAVAKVIKSDGSVSYALVEKDGKGNSKIIKDFGSISAIKKIESYHPFAFLKSSYVPKFKTAKKDERIAYLTKKYGDEEEWSKFTTKELDAIIINKSVESQKNTEIYG